MVPPGRKITTNRKGHGSPLPGFLPELFHKLYVVLVGQGARQGYLAAFDQAQISLANFLATLLLARNASPTELGIYGVGFTALRLVRAIQEGVTIQPLNTYGAGMDQKAFKSYATSTSLIQVALASALRSCCSGRRLAAHPARKRCIRPGSFFLVVRLPVVANAGIPAAHAVYPRPGA